MRFYYGNSDTKKRIIQIDGKFDDWKPEFLLATDSLGDSKTTAYDLKAVYGVRDDMYLYLMVEFEGGLRDIPGKDLIGLNFDLDGDGNSDVPGGIIKNPSIWWTILHDDLTFSKYRFFGLVGNNSSNSLFEARIPLRVLNYSNYIFLPRLGVGDLIEAVENDFIDGPIKITSSTNVNNEPYDSDLYPHSFKLSQNYPNPFNPSTTINFSIPKSSQVKITIYNIKGSLVKEILNKKLSAGFHTIKWDGKNKAGVEVSTGIYFYQIKTDTYSKTKKMLKIQ